MPIIPTHEADGRLKLLVTNQYIPIQQYELHHIAEEIIKDAALDDARKIIATGTEGWDDEALRTLLADMNARLDAAEANDTAARVLLGRKLFAPDVSA